MLSFSRLPVGDKTVKNGLGNDVTAHTFLGEADLRTYDAATFKSEVLEKTNQKKPGELRAPVFGETDASLDYSKKQEKIREEFIGHLFKFLKKLVFEALCPNLDHKPESSLKLVTQIQTDDGGNVTRIPMTLYMTNLSIMAGCLGNKYPVDIVDHGLANMDPIVRDHLLAIWNGHRVPRERDAFSQTQALLELKK